MVPAATVAELIADALRFSPVPVEGPEPVADEYEPTWRERLWIVPAETRIGVAELTEALGRPRSWVYRHTSGKTIPHRKLDGELVFVAGEIRAWIRDREEVEAGGPMDSTPGERAGHPYLKAS
jgi:predicted DNA-binding transcriptional regulator AlpA